MGERAGGAAMALCIRLLACLPGLCRRQAPGTAATSVLTQRRKRPSPGPSQRPAPVGTPGSWDSEPHSRRLGLSHALAKEQRRRRKEDMMKEVSRPAPLLRLRQATGPNGPHFSFPRRKTPLGPSSMGFCFWGELPGCRQMPLSLLACFSALPSRQRQQRGAAEITAEVLQPPLPAAVHFPMKPRGDCHLSYRA
uniref:Uncharacterized protein n=1 Tax=Pipistrellus kuhlii TaxID=59472 RepID=A0A7J7ZJ83_PIPKU|nr:hypothetical protein mPipKuh1_009447 [Pipistrellus kuhlii]